VNRRALLLNRRALLSLLFAGAPAALLPAAPAPAQGDAPVETVARFYGATPIGVAVSRTGRVFLSFPRAFDQGPYDVAEIRGGRPVPYPDAAVNRLPGAAPASRRLVSVQGLTVDADDRLWLLDCGKIKTGPPAPGAAKLVGVDLKTDRIVRTILFPPSVAGPNAYLNDVRVDLRRGRAGTAFITDSSEAGPNGIVVVDLATGASRRRLNGHPSVKAEPGFTPVVEGGPLLKRPPNGPPARDRTGADGLTLTPDGQYLYYVPNQGHRLYRVRTQALADPRATDAQVAATVEDLGDRGFASDGIEADSAGYIYLTDYEHNAVRRRSPAGQYEIVAQGPALIWPDSIAFRRDGYMYLTVDQLDRQAKYHRGHDLRRKPILLVRQRTGSQPVALK
jgi:sugar lactone lactonase YvrE